MLTGSCATAAADFVKNIVLSDGDSVSDGMTVACTFDYANTAGNSPSGQTVYSSDQITYYEDSELTVPVTLAPEGCYTIEYTGTGNAYTYVCYPVLQIENVKAPLKDSQGNILSGNIWQNGEKIMLTYTAGYFMRTGSGGDTDIDFYETEAAVDAALASMPDGQYAAWPSEGASLSVPIDEVKSGDMHAVTSNAVANLFNDYTSLSVTESVSYTATRKGLYYIRVVSTCNSSGTPDNVYLNDKLISVCATLKTGADSYNMLMVVTIPVFMKSGDVLRIAQVQSSSYSRIQPLGVFYM